MDFMPGAEIVFESYLYKTPPLDKLLVSWKKRWFVLSRSTDLHNSTTIEFSYYSDCLKKEKKGTIDLSKITSVNPSPSKSKEHVFSLETSDRKYIFKAPDTHTKEIWVAKLLELCGKDDAIYHVTVPYQPSSTQCEGVLKLNTPRCVTVVSPTSIATPIMEIPFGQIRRFGSKVVYDTDLVWFETCDCKLSDSDFCFMSVASGIEKAYQIIQELKRNIECTTGNFLILEESDEATWSYTYVARKHYGCPAFPTVARDRVLQAGLMNLHSSYGAMQLHQMNKFRRQSEFAARGGSLPVNQDRRHTVATLNSSGKSPAHSPSPSPTPSPSPVRRAGHSPSHSPPPVRRLSPSPSPTTSPHSSGHLTLAQLQHRPNRPARHSREEFDSGVSLDKFDPCRHSAPSVPPSQTQSTEHRRGTLEQFRKKRSLDELTYRKMSSASPRCTLAQLQDQRSTDREHYRSHAQEPGKDSALGTSADFLVEAQKTSGVTRHHYDHLEVANGVSGYDHLPPVHRHTSPNVSPRSLKSLGKQRDNPYTEG